MVSHPLVSSKHFGFYQVLLAPTLHCCVMHRRVRAPAKLAGGVDDDDGDYEPEGRAAKGIAAMLERGNQGADSEDELSEEAGAEAEAGPSNGARRGRGGRWGELLACACARMCAWETAVCHAVACCSAMHGVHVLVHIISAARDNASHKRHAGDGHC